MAYLTSNTVTITAAGTTLFQKILKLTINKSQSFSMLRLLNIENDWDGALEDKVEGPCELINEKEVEKAIKVMKAGKTVVPSEVVGEMLKAAGNK